MHLSNLGEADVMAPAVCDHVVLPATRHRWTCPAL